jgi:PASTA domain-containing protein
MTDYSRAGPPGDHGLVAPPGGGLFAPGGANGAHGHDAPEPGEGAPLGAKVDAGLGGDPLDHLDDDLLDEDLDDEFDDDDDDDDEEERAPAAAISIRPREPVPRRTKVVSIGIATGGLVALIVAVVFAFSGIGPIDRPLFISPVGLDATPGSTAGAVAAVPPKPGGKVPRVIGMTFARAKMILEGAGFRVEARYQQGSQPRETVLSQSPAPGTQLGRRGLVTLVVSLGLIEGPVTGPPPTSAPATTRRPTSTTRRPSGTTSKPTVTTSPQTTSPTTNPTTTTSPPPPTTTV